MIPPEGEPARFGLELAGNEVFLKADLDWAGDYHEGFTIAVPKALPVGIEGLILKNRLVFNGRAGDGTFITTPSTCLGAATPGPSGSVYSTFLLAGSYAEEEQPGYELPPERRTAIRVADPARDLAERMHDDSLRPLDRGQTGDDRNRLARRGGGGDRRSPHPRRGRTGQLRRPGPRR